MSVAVKKSPVTVTASSGPIFCDSTSCRSSWEWKTQSAGKKEFNFSYKFDQWNNMLDNAVRLSPPPPEPELAPAANVEPQPANFGETSPES